MIVVPERPREKRVKAQRMNPERVNEGSPSRTWAGGLLMVISDARSVISDDGRDSLGGTVTLPSMMSCFGLVDRRDHVRQGLVLRVGVGEADTSPT